MSKEKVVVIGLDGATFDLLGPWIDKGFLPTFKKIRDNGVAVPMASTTLPISASAWTSLFTGKNPANHRVVDFFYREKDSYNVTPITSRTNKAQTLFSMLSRAGKKIIAMNIPVTYPPEEVNGILVTGLHTPSGEVEFTYPKELKEELNHICNGYEIHAGAIVSKGNIDKYLQKLNSVTQKQMKAAEYLMKEKEWDFFMYVVQGTDQIQHALWHFMDESHPLHVPGNKYKDAILDFYRAIDDYLNRLLSKMPEGASLLIVSDHGAGPLYKLINLNNWLIENKFMVLKKDIKTCIKRLLYRLNITPLLIFHILLRLRLGWMKGKVTRGRGQGKLKKLFLSFDDVDWLKTKAYSLGNIGQIYINLRGREPLGSVDENEYEKVRSQLKSSLLKMKDSACDVKVVDKVFCKEEIFKGEFADKMPDIVFLPKDFSYFSFGDYEFASNKVFEPALSPTGTHRENGILMAYGGNITNTIAPSKVNITDVTPTVLNLMGIEVAGNFDGRALLEIIKEQTANKMFMEASDGESRQESYRYKDDEVEKLKQNLHDLGYIG